MTTGAVVDTAATATNTAAQNTGIIARARAVVAMTAQKVARLAVSAATKAAAAAQWLLNAAFLANPVGAVILGLVALGGLFVLLYKKVGWFRDGVNFLWNNALKPLGKFIATIFIGHLESARQGLAHRRDLRDPGLPLARDGSVQRLRRHPVGGREGPGVGPGDRRQDQGRPGRVHRVR
ncbi:hypothetical protein G5V59_00190 [Nocardioides sp. W3-2-3]|uniref:hypothetical protein n=1 Tax=Nocardioides convexus TaxID=2712224 RepID=UPI0024186DBF|nr:hypothetical protein [Nocardioides convexus]NGZ99392.1 hypothetical protein [Nocardioides convexus]